MKQQQMQKLFFCTVNPSKNDAECDAYAGRKLCERAHGLSLTYRSRLSRWSRRITWISKFGPDGNFSVVAIRPTVRNLFHKCVTRNRMVLTICAGAS